MHWKPRWGRATVVAVLGSAALALTAAPASAQGTSGAVASTEFTLTLSPPAFNRNAIVAVRISCPGTERRCVGALAVSTIGNPQATNPALRPNRTIGTSPPFTIIGGRSLLVKLAMPLSIVRLLRNTRAPALEMLAVALADDPQTGRLGSGVGGHLVTLAPKDKRLRNIRRLRITLTGASVNSAGVLMVRVGCSARVSECVGVISATAVEPSSTRHRLPPLGGAVLAVPGGQSELVQIKLSRSVLRKLKQRYRNPQILLYALATTPTRSLAGYTLGHVKA